MNKFNFKFINVNLTLSIRSDEKGQIKLINENTIISKLNRSSTTRFIVFPTVGYGYCVITFGSASSFNSPVDPKLWIYATFVEAKKNKVSESALIYQHTNNNPPLKINDITCGNSFIVVGYCCFIVVSDNSTNGRYIIQINFSSTG